MSVARKFSQQVFEEEFALESLKSDRLRVTILIGAIVSALLILGLLIPIFANQFEDAFHGNFRRFLLAVCTIFSINLVYLIGERIVLGRLIERRQQAITALRYISAFVETSIPTAGMIVASFFCYPFTLCSRPPLFCTRFSFFFPRCVWISG